MIHYPSILSQTSEQIIQLIRASYLSHSVNATTSICSPFHCLFVHTPSSLLFVRPSASPLHFATSSCLPENSLSLAFIHSFTPFPSLLCFTAPPEIFSLPSLHNDGVKVFGGGQKRWSDRRRENQPPTGHYSLHFTATMTNKSSSRS